MYLSKLEIFGFKSFADKTTVEFDRGVSAIVGPNGSGKSNIVDAMRWVLGEQGDKALRSEKREDVVFSGTRNRKPLSVAEVSLTIINNKGVLPTEYQEVQIARRFYRSGETEYYLNGTKVRLKDIKELFVDTGIGPDAYSVIELKMVDTILSYVKNERRKLFEEAAGIVSYKHNRDLTFNRLESVKESISRVNDIIREKQRGVNQLERQAKRNEEAKLVSEELRTLEITVYRIDFRTLVAEIENIKNNEGSGIQIKQDLTEEVAGLDENIDRLRTEISVKENSVYEISSELGQLRSDISLHERNNAVNTEKLRSLKINLQALEEQNKSLSLSLERNIEKEAEFKKKVNVLKETLHVSEISLSDKKSKVDEIIALISSKKAEFSGLTKQIKDSNKSVTDKKSEYERAKLKYDNNLNQQEKISDSNKDILGQLDELNTKKSELESSLRKSLDALRTAELDLKKNEAQKQKFADNLLSLSNEINNLQIEIQKKKIKIDSINALMDSYDDYSEGIKLLIKDEKTQGVETLLDAIEVEEKFRVAIETALGEVSTYLILDNSSKADSIISKVAAAGKGKVTLILNDILNYKDENYFMFETADPSFINEKGVFGIADQYAHCKKDEHILLFKYILDEYVIVDNYRTAQRLAKDNFYKFITLDGDIVTKSFIRAGSQTNPESVRLGREQQIELLTEQMSVMEKKHVEQAARHTSLSEDHSAIDLKIFKDKYDLLRKACDDIEIEISKIDFRKSELNKAVQSNDESYNTLSKTNSELILNIDSYINNIDVAEKEQANYDKELGFLTDELEVVEKDFSEHSTSYNSFNIEVTKLKNELKIEEQNLSRTQGTIDFQKKNITGNNATISNNENEITALNILLQDLSIDLASKKDKEKVVSVQYNEQKTDLDAKRTEQNKLDLEQRKKRIELDEISLSMVNAQIKIRENELKSEQAKDYIYKQYSLDISSPTAIFNKAAVEDGLEDRLNEMQNEGQDQLQGEVVTDFVSTEQSSDLPADNLNPVSDTESENEFPEEAGTDFDIDDSRIKINKLSERLKQLGGYQQSLFFDFETEKRELEELIIQKDDLLESEKDIRKTIERINKEARERFLITFEKIRENFITIFKELFQEGDEANLKLVYEEDEDGKFSEDPLEAKIEITAKPKGKRPTTIELLSGGEKTLTAIALLFAIYLVKPSPFCILDEVDAPLDVANLGRFNKMIRKFSDNTQFILITHNERTMESVDRLYGVTMQEPGVTTIVETKFKD
ncbi:chromosome segregation protein SMC [soil metagenome]